LDPFHRYDNELTCGVVVGGVSYKSTEDRRGVANGQVWNFQATELQWPVKGEVGEVLAEAEAVLDGG
jgi:hypothetical protein